MRRGLATGLIVSLVLAAVIGVSLSFPASSAGSSVARQTETARMPTHPHDVDELSPPTRTDGGPGLLILPNDGFVVGYDERRRNPAWVSYTFAGAISHVGHKRESGFDADTRTAAHVVSTEYTNSGFDRGHMAPSFGIFSFDGEPAEREAYRMSNILPQTHALNAGPWEKVEMLEARDWAPHEGKIRVFCGPAYREPVATIGRGVAVPFATWKIVVRATSVGRFEAVAFFMPQTADIHDPPSKYLTSVRAIEAATHLDFFAALPDDEESALETPVAPVLWQ